MMDIEEYNRLQYLRGQRSSLFKQLESARTPIQNQLEANWQEQLTLQLKCDHEWVNPIHPGYPDFVPLKSGYSFFDSPYCKHCGKTYY